MLGLHDRWQRGVRSTVRTCTKCGEAKPATEFWSRPDRPRTNLRSWCIECASTWHRNHKLLTKYGLTLEDFEAMLERQGGGCAICEAPPTGEGNRGRLHVDHDHATGRVRGLLCHRCNWGIGHFGDSAEVMQKAYRYLVRTRGRGGSR